MNVVSENTICNCTEDYCAEDTCPCMNLPCEDVEHICEEPRGCLEDCTCVRIPNETRGECQT